MVKGGVKGIGGLLAFYTTLRVVWPLYTYLGINGFLRQGLKGVFDRGKYETSSTKKAQSSMAV
jgi:hypothetical protein